MPVRNYTIPIPKKNLRPLLIDFSLWRQRKASTASTFMQALDFFVFSQLGMGPRHLGRCVCVLLVFRPTMSKNKSSKNNNNNNTGPEVIVMILVGLPGKPQIFHHFVPSINLKLIYYLLIFLDQYLLHDLVIL
jgi:hypothetical protein